jgi:polyhydroxyalkanoate synthesis regulator phasin
VKDVIHSAEDHSPLLKGIGVGQHNFKWCPVAEKSDVDAAEKNAKDFAGWLAGQSREELARAMADLGRRLESRLNQLEEAKSDLEKVQELACRVRELDAKLELVEKGGMKTIRADLDTLERRMKVMEQLPKPPGPAGPSPSPLPDVSPYEGLEIGLKKIELNLRDAVERIGRLEQPPASSAEPDCGSSFWTRLRWLFRGP